MNTPRNEIAGRSRSLIVRSGGGLLEALTLTTAAGADVLPIFSFREEGEMYLHLCLGSVRDGWRIRETSSGELASILCGPCRGLEAVVLDPLPEACCGALNGLLSIRREVFLQTLLDEGAHLPSRLRPRGAPGARRGGPLRSARRGLPRYLPI